MFPARFVTKITLAIRHASFDTNQSKRGVFKSRNSHEPANFSFGMGVMFSYGQLPTFLLHSGRWRIQHFIVRVPYQHVISYFAAWVIVRHLT